MASSLASGVMRSGNSYFLHSPMLHAASSAVPGAARTKFVLVTGGVCSSLGKGVTTSSIGALLKAAGFLVSSIKIDPYINIDAGLMSPYEHGEVYVLHDGGEVDLDLGNYERWMRIKLCRDHNITTGKVYQTLIEKERRGEFLGKTVQVVPHVTGEVTRRIEEVSKICVDGSGMKPQICLIELGGTVGDIESAPFIEALRQLRFSLPPEDFALMHVTHLPEMSGSQKTKPTQHSWRTLLSLGMSPDFLICRSDRPLQEDARRKLSSLCGMQEKYIIDAHNCHSLYEVPLLFHGQDIVAKIIHKLRMDVAKVLPPALGVPSLEDYRALADKTRQESTPRVSIAFVGKYCEGGTDAYFSVMQAFEHASLSVDVKIDFMWVDAATLEGDSPSAVEARLALTKVQGIYVAGGFGNRGIQGKILAARIARQNSIPYLGVCLGMQVAIIEMGQDCLGLADATSEEFEADAKAPVSKNHVIMFMPEIDRTTMGANMRLGEREICITDPSSIVSRMYGGALRIRERHRHRYEFNMSYLEAYKTQAQLSFVASDDPAFGPETRIEGVQLKAHPFFVGVQCHPEFQSWPNDPSPPYAAFVAAAAGKPSLFGLNQSFNSRAIA